LHQVQFIASGVANPYYNNPSATAAFDAQRAPNYGWNTHPRIPRGIVVRMEHSHTGWIEGCYINAQDMQGDVCVFSTNGESGAANNQFRRLYIQNSRIVNWEGGSTHKNYGDQVHGDSVQNQGDTGYPHSIWFENCWFESGQEGQVDTGGGGFKLKHLFVRNCQYTLKPPATNWINLNDYSPPGEKSGGPPFSSKGASVATEGQFSAGGTWEIDNVWISNKDFALTIGPSLTKITPANNSEVHSGVSPINFAPIAQIGVNYVSPHG
jgi:hypothetical protein